MGELLDSLNEMDVDSRAAGEPAAPLVEPMTSIIDEATESVIGRADGTPRRQDATLNTVKAWVREAPLQSLAVAFLLGAAFSRRRG